MVLVMYSVDKNVSLNGWKSEYVLRESHQDKALTGERNDQSLKIKSRSVLI